MQAPKESLDAAIAANWATAQADPPPVQDPNNVTGNSLTSLSRSAQRCREDSFARGMREGADPYIFAESHDAAADRSAYRMGSVMVMVSGLEMLQAEDPEALGFVKGALLKKLYCEANPTVAGRVSRETAADVGQGVGMPDPGVTRGPMLQMLISTQFLSEVLHELAGMASMCWTQPPKGVFDSTRCLDAVAHALKRLAPEPSPNRVHVEPDNDAVICPACAHQFGAIPVNVQKELAHYRATPLHQGQDNGA